MVRSIYLMTAAAGIAVSTAAGAQTYSFESPGAFVTYNPTGYAGVTFAGNSGVALQGTIFTVAPPDGTQAAFIQTTALSGPTNVGTVSFALTGLTAGTSYGATFYAAQRPNYGTGGSFDTPAIAISFNGVLLGAYNAASRDFTQFTVPSFLALGQTGTLTFAGVYTPSSDATVLFDLVSVQPLAGPPAAAAVPEPATWAMTILGVGAIGFAMRRRQKVGTRLSYAG